MSNTTYVPYRKVLELAGFSKRTLNQRILREGIPTYVDARDRRRRLINVQDLAKLVEVRPARRGEKTAA